MIQKNPSTQRTLDEIRLDIARLMMRDFERWHHVAGDQRPYDGPSYEELQEAIGKLHTEYAEHPDTDALAICLDGIIDDDTDGYDIDKDLTARFGHEYSGDSSHDFFSAHVSRRVAPRVLAYLREAYSCVQVEGGAHGDPEMDIHIPGLASWDDARNLLRNRKEPTPTDSRRVGTLALQFYLPRERKTEAQARRNLEDPELQKELRAAVDQVLRRHPATRHLTAAIRPPNT